MFRADRFCIEAETKNQKLDIFDDTNAVEPIQDN